MSTTYIAGSPEHEVAVPKFRSMWFDTAFGPAEIMFEFTGFTYDWETGEPTMACYRCTQSHRQCQLYEAGVNYEFPLY